MAQRRFASASHKGNSCQSLMGITFVDYASVVLFVRLFLRGMNAKLLTVTLWCLLLLALRFRSAQLSNEDLGHAIGDVVYAVFETRAHAEGDVFSVV